MMHLVALLSVLLFCSCEPREKLGNVNSDLKQLMTIICESMGQPSSVIIDETAKMNIMMKESENNTCDLAGYYNGNKISCFVNDDDEIICVVFVYNFYETYTYGGHLYLDLTNSIFAYGWNHWHASTGGRWNGKSGVNDMNLREDYVEHMTEYFTQVTEYKIDESESFEKPIGSEYLYAHIYYDADSGKEEPMFGDPVPLNKKEKVQSIIRFTIEYTERSNFTH